MKALEIVGAVLAALWVFSVISCLIVGARADEDGDDKEFSGLLEED